MPAAMASTCCSLVATFAFSLLAAAQTTPQACNNSPALCDRAYNNVTYLGAHDSSFVRNSSNGYSVAGNQFFTSPVQLDSGVRLLTSQIHKVQDLAGDRTLHLCHTDCALYDAGTVSGWLTTVRQWLDMNPNAVITILLVNGDNVNAHDIDAEFQTAGISHYAYTPTSTTSPPTTWPTLASLIATDKRLIVFIQPLSPATNTEARYLLDQFTFTFENNYDVTSATSFSCTANRPTPLANKTSTAISSGRLPLLNHFLDDKFGTTDIEIPAVESAEDTNAPSDSAMMGNLGYAAEACSKVYGKPPNYLLVDFANAGPAIDTTDRLNGLSKAQIVGRRSLPTQVYNEGPGPSQTAALVRSLGSGTTGIAMPRPTSTTASMSKMAGATGATSDAAEGQGVFRLGAKGMLGSVLGIPLLGMLGHAILWIPYMF